VLLNYYYFCPLEHRHRDYFFLLKQFINPSLLNSTIFFSPKIRILEIINIYLALFNFSGSTKYHPLFVLVFFLLFLKVMSLPTKKKTKGCQIL